MKNTVYQEARRAIIAHTGWTDEQFAQAMADIVQHGVEVGYTGFIYHKDNLTFVKENLWLCQRILEDVAMRKMASPAEALKSLPWAPDIEDPFYELAFDTDDAGFVATTIAWLVLHEVANY